MIFVLIAVCQPFCPQEHFMLVFVESIGGDEKKVVYRGLRFLPVE